MAPVFAFNTYIYMYWMRTRGPLNTYWIWLDEQAITCILWSVLNKPKTILLNPLEYIAVELEIDLIPTEMQTLIANQAIIKRFVVGCVCPV